MLTEQELACYKGEAAKGKRGLRVEQPLKQNKSKICILYYDRKRKLDELDCFKLAALRCISLGLTVTFC